MAYTYYHHMYYSLGLREMTEVLDLDYFMILLFYFFNLKISFKEKIISIHLMQGHSPMTHNHVTIYEHLEWLLTENKSTTMLVSKLV